MQRHSKSLVTTDRLLEFSGVRWPRDGTTISLTGHPHTLTGEFRMHQDFRSRFLATPRDVLVYLPPGYREDLHLRYPVLYLHDGQNLFDGASSYVPGQEWGVDETAQELIGSRIIEPLIIVGIYNGTVHRVEEYTPSVDTRMNRGGQADLYGRLLVEELKPLVDARYRTRPGETGLGGSSLGGLVTIYLGLRHPDVFGQLIVMSPSVWWNRSSILREVDALKVKPSTRIWLDIGTHEGRYTVKQARLLRDALIYKGWQLGADLKYFEAKNGFHHEAAWGERVAPALRFLYPKRHP